MGLFDGQVKSFATKIVAALRERAVQLDVAAQEYQGTGYERHKVGALILNEMANIIAKVSEIE